MLFDGSASKLTDGRTAGILFHPKLVLVLKKATTADCEVSKQVFVPSISCSTREFYKKLLKELFMMI